MYQIPMTVIASGMTIVDSVISAIIIMDSLASVDEINRSLTK